MSFNQLLLYEYPSYAYDLIGLCLILMDCTLFDWNFILLLLCVSPYILNVGRYISLRSSESKKRYRWINLRNDQVCSFNPFGYLEITIEVSVCMTIM